MKVLRVLISTTESSYLFVCFFVALGRACSIQGCRIPGGHSHMKRAGMLLRNFELNP